MEERIAYLVKKHGITFNSSSLDSFSKDIKILFSQEIKNKINKGLEKAKAKGKHIGRPKGSKDFKPRNRIKARLRFLKQDNYKKLTKGEVDYITDKITAGITYKEYRQIKRIADHKIAIKYMRNVREI